MILLCSATEFEIKPAIDWINTQKHSDIQTLITGVGSPATMFHLMKAIETQKPQMIIQAGIAGSFRKSLVNGSVVVVKSDQWCDLGIEDHEQFHSIFDMHFTNPNALPYTNRTIICDFPILSNINNIPRVKAVTSNTAHGNRSSITRLINKFNPDIETMEGAAAAYICAMENIPFLQLRAISNFVEPRNKNAWNIPLAKENLNHTLINILQ